MKIEISYISAVPLTIGSLIGKEFTPANGTLARLASRFLQTFPMPFVTKYRFTKKSIGRELKHTSLFFDKQLTPREEKMGDSN